MAYAKLEGKFDSCPELNEYGNAAYGLYARGLAHCANHLTDGHLSFRWVAERTVGEEDLVEQLLDAGVWERTEKGFCCPAYLRKNKSRAEVEAEREASKQRAEKSRNRGKQRPKAVAA